MDGAQLSILDLIEAPGPARLAPKRATIAERCAAFDAVHPEVYATIRALALEAHRSGRTRAGIAEFDEVARWKLRTGGRDADGYKLNNSYRAIWARRLVAEHPELTTMFEIRARRAA